MTANFDNGNYTTTPLFFAPFGPRTGSGGATTATFANVNLAVVPVACTVSALNAAATIPTSSSGSADNPTIRVYKNGSATSMSVSFSVGVTAGSKGGASTTANTFTVVAGDTLSLLLTETNSTPAYYYGTTLKCQ